MAVIKGTNQILLSIFVYNLFTINYNLSITFCTRTNIWLIGLNCNIIFWIIYEIIEMSFEQLPFDQSWIIKSIRSDELSFHDSYMYSLNLISITISIFYDFFFTFSHKIQWCSHMLNFSCIGNICNMFIQLTQWYMYSQTCLKGHPYIMNHCL